MTGTKDSIEKIILFVLGIDAHVSGICVSICKMLIHSQVITKFVMGVSKGGVPFWQAVVLLSNKN